MSFETIPSQSSAEDGAMVDMKTTAQPSGSLRGTRAIGKTVLSTGWSAGPTLERC